MNNNSFKQYRKKTCINEKIVLIVDIHNEMTSRWNNTNG
jgi:hypothetical protein